VRQAVIIFLTRSPAKILDRINMSVLNMNAWAALLWLTMSSNQLYG
jgi:hypothetical protein